MPFPRHLLAPMIPGNLAGSAHLRNACTQNEGDYVLVLRLEEADILVATDSLGVANVKDDDGLESPDAALRSQMSTGAYSRSLLSDDAFFRLAPLVCCQTLVLLSFTSGPVAFWAMP